MVSPSGFATGAVGGATTGAMLGGPWGAVAGGVIGGVGGLFGGGEGGAPSIRRTQLGGGSLVAGADQGFGGAPIPMTGTPLSRQQFSAARDLMVQTGGAHLLTNIVLGADVNRVIAGQFGKQVGSDWDSFYNSLNRIDQSAIDGVREQLSQIQQNTELRNQAVQKVIDDFPNVVSQVAPQVVAAKQRAGEEFDQASQQYMKMALDQVSARQAAGGGFSSGATAQAAANTGAQMGLQRLNYTSGQADQALNINQMGWQARLAEADALRGFQQRMLGQGVEQGFHASQNSLQMQQQRDIQQSNLDSTMHTAEAGYGAQYAQQQNQANQGLFGSIGGLTGSAIGAYAQSRGGFGNMFRGSQPSSPFSPSYTGGGANLSLISRGMPGSTL